MKLVALTQRVAIDPATGERRDCLDQRWPALIAELGAIATALPNSRAEQAGPLLERLRPDAIILTGGNSLTGLEPNADDGAPERDAFEERLIDEASSREIPLLGVCRGMQVINRHFGGSLTRVVGHVAQEHSLTIEWPGISDTRQVNSFHNWGIAPGDLAPALAAFARDRDGYVEGAVHPDRRIAAIMWHPERMRALSADDRVLLEAFL